RPPPPDIGLIRWEQARARWTSGGSRDAPRRRAKSMDVDQVIDTIFSGTSDGTLPSPVTLPQMVDLLVDLWEAEGLFD
ncbi:unnamed protein product, partial [Phaeothamnion confervicola]